MKTSTLALALALALLFSACAPSSLAADAPAEGAGAKRKPNVIVFLTDDLGYGDVGCYGAKPEHVKTPNIDRLAAEGLRFTDGHAASSVCTPSRYSLLTGEYAFRNPGESGILPGDAPLGIKAGSLTLPALFKAQGYATGFVGKWHLGLGREQGKQDWNGAIDHGPLDIGFDKAFFMAATGDRTPTVYLRDRRVEGLDPKDPITVSYRKPVGDDYKRNPELATVLRPVKGHGHDEAVTAGVSRIGYMTGGKAALWKDEDVADTLSREAVKFIGDHKDKPFFLYYATHNIHEPRVPHPRFVGKSGAGTYGDHILELDDKVGVLMAEIKRLGIDEDTLVVFSSDNGGCTWFAYDYEKGADLHGHRVNGVLRGEKFSVFEGGTREPFIVRWPGHVPAGATSPALLSQTDLMASFADMLGAKLPDDAAADSVDVLPALLGESKIGRSELVEHQSGGPKNCALRVGDWKFIGGKLFDLSKDLSEEHDLAAQMPEKAREMEKRLRELTGAKRTR